MRVMTRTVVWLAFAARVASAQATSFAGLITRLSEPGGYFTGDNLVSNETSYLHVIPALHARGLHGGAFIGVGPEQNFSYIAETHPDIAFVVDIRRDNMLLHLLYKAIFETTASRLDYLCALYSRPVPPDVAEYKTRDLAQVLAYIDRTPFDGNLHERTHRALIARIERDGVVLSPDDQATLRRFHDEIAHGGLDLKFELPPNRVPSRDYPVVRRLYTERDVEGRQTSYVATEERWSTVRALEAADKVIPVTGDFAGSKAIRAIGDYLREIHEPVSVFYTSNVEFYLQRGGLREFAANVRALPVAPNAVIIRSWFEQGGSYIPSLRPGHFSAQLLEPLAGFLKVTESIDGLTYRRLLSDTVKLGR